MKRLAEKKEHKKKTKIQILDINGDWINIYNDWSEVRGKELDGAGYFENIRFFRKRDLVSIYREVEVDEK